MTARSLMTPLLALTLMVFVGGCDSELDETSNLAALPRYPCGEGTEPNADGTRCVAAYDCFRGGFCSEAAVDGWFTEADGNIYAGDTKASSGCDDPCRPALQACLDTHCEGGCTDDSEDWAKCDQCMSDNCATERDSCFDEEDDSGIYDWDWGQFVLENYIYRPGLDSHLPRDSWQGICVAK